MRSKTTQESIRAAPDGVKKASPPVLARQNPKRNLQDSGRADDRYRQCGRRSQRSQDEHPGLGPDLGLEVGVEVEDDILEVTHPFLDPVHPLLDPVYALLKPVHPLLESAHPQFKALAQGLEVGFGSWFRAG